MLSDSTDLSQHRQSKVKRIARSMAMDDPWLSDSWGLAPVLRVDQFHVLSSSHRPITTVKLLHDGVDLHVVFRVQDRFVRCVHTEYQSEVYLDSCVEFFLQPIAGGSYLNFEINCGGALLLYFIEDPTPGDAKPFRKFCPVPEKIARLIKIEASMPRRIEPEISDPITWTIRASVPFSLFEQFVGRVGEIAGQRWRGNFFKCGDQTSHPHWASWSPIGNELRFHQPELFGSLIFD
jgi:hypothetical protein